MFILTISANNKNATMLNNLTFKHEIPHKFSDKLFKCTIIFYL